MPYIHGILHDEYERLQEKKQDYEQKLKDLPLDQAVRRQQCEKSLASIKIDMEFIEKAFKANNVPLPLADNLGQLHLTGTGELNESITYAIRSNAMEGLETKPETIAMLKKIEAGEMTYDQAWKITDSKAKLLAQKNQK